MGRANFTCVIIKHIFFIWEETFANLYVYTPILFHKLEKTLV